MLVKTEGIVLRTLDYGEGNKILTVFTKEMGKVGIVARGARKTKSRLGAVSQPFILAHFIFHLGTGLGSLQQGEIVLGFPKIRLDLFRTAYTTYILELTERLTEDRHRNAILYGLLSDVLLHMDAGKDPEVLACIFELKVLSMSGYKPRLNACSACQKGMAPWFFSAREGGLLCSSCNNMDRYAFSLPQGLPQLLYQLQEIDVENLGQIKLKETTKMLIKKVLQRFMDEHVGLQLKSKRFIDQLQKMEDNLAERGHDIGEKPAT